VVVSGVSPARAGAGRVHKSTLVAPARKLVKPEAFVTRSDAESQVVWLERHTFISPQRTRVLV